MEKKRKGSIVRKMKKVENQREIKDIMKMKHSIRKRRNNK